MGPHVATFRTELGIAGIAWRSDTVVAVALPERREAAVRARLARRVPDGVPGAPPAAVQDVIARIVELIAGHVVDFSDVAVDVGDASPLARQVYAIARGIPYGSTMTYGQVAAQLGDPLLARDVGQALGHNPVPIVVPCHRVVAANGKLGGFSAPGGAETKRKLLVLEGAGVAPPSLFD